jgi:hypothetical protein
MNTQKGFSTITALVIIVIIILAGIYFFPKQVLTPQIEDETLTQVEQVSNIEIQTISDTQIILSNNTILSIDEFPDEIDVSAESSFGSSDKFKGAELSPDDKWLAIAIGGAAHDFGWIYNIETTELKLIAFQYGGGVKVKEWISTSQVVLILETPEPKTIEKIVNITNLTQYPN